MSYGDFDEFDEDIGFPSGDRFQGSWERQYAEYLERQMESQLEEQYKRQLEEQYIREMEEQYQTEDENLMRLEWESENYHLLEEEIDSDWKEEMIHPESVAHRLLHLPLEEKNDARAMTVGEYLGLLLSTLWLQGEEFSGKRPFGNSDWQYDIYVPMIKAGLAVGELDEDGYVEVFTYEAQIAADELILQAIKLAYNHD